MGFAASAIAFSIALFIVVENARLACLLDFRAHGDRALLMIRSSSPGSHSKSAASRGTRSIAHSVVGIQLPLVSMETCVGFMVRLEASHFLLLRICFRRSWTNLPNEFESS